MVTASNRSSGESKEDKKGGAPSNGHVSSQCEGRQKDGGELNTTSFMFSRPRPPVCWPSLGGSGASGVWVLVLG
ncbi:hypothetical protein E2C01_004118 [Portunus trituberculatus]|uniref:Uncharacterized protein n=1 Tax=Portunus trituberculatus TaxID=210409 RepID=A0A5B7CRJ7_PORTR|nr:hypothetical protein [Portunus trituberculatus]